MALRRSADLSRMIVEAEMRTIGIAPDKAKLHPKQYEVLKKAQDPKVNVMVLYGGTGSGKTVLASEIVKIWMAEHFENDVSNKLCLLGVSEGHPQFCKFEVNM